MFFFGDRARAHLPLGVRLGLVHLVLGGVAPLGALVALHPDVSVLLRHGVLGARALAASALDAPAPPGGFGSGLHRRAHLLRAHRHDARAGVKAVGQPRLRRGANRQRLAHASRHGCLRRPCRGRSRARIWFDDAPRLPPLAASVARRVATGPRWNLTHLRTHLAVPAGLRSSRGDGTVYRRSNLQKSLRTTDLTREAEEMPGNLEMLLKRRQRGVLLGSGEMLRPLTSRGPVSREQRTGAPPGSREKLSRHLSKDIRSGRHASRRLLGGGIFLYSSSSRGCIRQSHVIPPAVCSSASRRTRDDDRRGWGRRTIRGWGIRPVAETHEGARDAPPRGTRGRPPVRRSLGLLLFPRRASRSFFVPFRPARFFARARDARRDAPSARSFRVDRVVSKNDASRRAAHPPASTSRSTTLAPPARWVHQNDARSAPKPSAVGRISETVVSRSKSSIISPPPDLTRPPPPQVRVTGNNRTKSSLIGLTGVVKKSVGLGGWHWLVRRPASPLDGRSVGERVRSFEIKRRRTNTPPVRSTTDTHLRRFFVPDPPHPAETLHRPRVSSAEKRAGRDFATDRF